MTVTSTAPATPRIDGHYGERPVGVDVAGSHRLDLSAAWTEFMHYLYLPVRIPASDPGLAVQADGTGDRFAASALPKALGFLEDAIFAAMADAQRVAPHLADPYVYVTARRGFASPGNPLNRPGWHTDDFGGTDLNYIWADKWPTRFVLSDQHLTLPEDDVESMHVMEMLATSAQIETERWDQKRIFNGNAPRPAVWMEHGDTNRMLRLSPYVIHDTPLIFGNGGMRSFFKISVSTHRYDLVGNSHNHEIDYEWQMHSRQALRNKPQGGDRDYSGTQEG